MTLPESLELMLFELECNQLQVVLAPSKRAINEWDMCRCVVSYNCAWYRRLASEHASKRGVRHGKFDTRIRRHTITSVLTRLVNGKPSVSKYTPELVKIAERRK